MAAVTDDHELGDSQQKCILTDLEATSLTSGSYQGHVPPRDSRGESVPCLFQLLVAGCVPRLVAGSFLSLSPLS